MSLQLSDLSVTLGGHLILEDIACEIPMGLTSILGLNGAGKTTLLKTILGFQAHQGQIFLENQELSLLSHRERARLLSYVPQEAAQGLSLPLLDFVLMGQNPHLHFFERPGQKARLEAEGILEELSISHLACRPMNALSGGEQKLAYLARARLQKSPWMLLDEPVSNLDFRRQHLFLEQLKDYLTNSQTSAIMTIHDPLLAYEYSSQILFLHEHRLLSCLHRGDKHFDREFSRCLKTLYGPEAHLASLPEQNVIIWRKHHGDHERVCSGSKPGGGL